jgi:hypothetical protein
VEGYSDFLMTSDDPLKITDEKIANNLLMTFRRVIR